MNQEAFRELNNTYENKATQLREANATIAALQAERDALKKQLATTVGQ